jgi:chromosome segregation ATPase
MSQIPDQSECVAKLHALQLSQKYLNAALEAYGQGVQPVIGINTNETILETVEALEKHCAALETKLATLPAATATGEDTIPNLKAQIASLQTELATVKLERDGLREKASFGEEEKKKMEGECQRKMASFMVKHGIRNVAKEGAATAPAQPGKKLSADERVAAAKR